MDTRVPLAAGTTLEDASGTSYKLESPIGRGGFAIKYGATLLTSDLGLASGTKVVVKEFFPASNARRNSDGEVEPLEHTMTYDAVRRHFEMEG